TAATPGPPLLDGTRDGVHTRCVALTDRSGPPSSIGAEVVLSEASPEAHVRLSSVFAVRLFLTQEVEMRSPLRLWTCALRAALVTGAIVATPGSAQVTGTVRGQLIDVTTRRPVDGAEVYVVGTDLRTLTNAGGRFELNVRAGGVDVRVRRFGYASATKHATVTPGEAVTVDFELN